MTLTTVNPALLDTQAQYTGFKNRIYNGQMQIDQRNAGASVSLVSGGGNAYPADRWYVENQTDGTATTQQVSDAPTGFSNSIKYTVTATDASLASDQAAWIQHRIEGFNFADMLYGTANAQTVAVSFLVKSSVTGTFGVALANSAYNRGYPASFTVSAANTWEQKTVVIAGDTTGTWVGSTNGIGVRVSFCMAAGSARSAASGAWGAGVILGVSSQVNLMATSGATFYITGVQLEKGSTATSFDYRPYGTELGLCLRYYYEFRPKGIGIPCLSWANTNNFGCFATFSHPVAMRAAPTVTYTSQTYNSASTSAPSGNNTSLTATNITAGNIDTLKFGVNNNESGNTLWSVYILGYASAEL